MPCNYLYIDDEEELVQQYIDALESHEELEITSIKPIEFSKLIKKILGSEVDGILIDWKLDERNHEDVIYKAGEVAQSLRSKSVENEENATPIILISTDEKLEKTFSLDETSHDLFDHIYTKSEVVESGERIAQELIYFASSYTDLREYKKTNKDVYEILGLVNVNLLDSRIRRHFLTKRGDLKPVHECARFIINDLLKIPGPLIDENTLAARLGISIKASDDWQVFKEAELNAFKYRGPFSSIWHLWWASELENWWSKQVHNKKPLQLLKAAQRVELLNEKLELDFSPAEPIEDNYCTEYWTICQDLKRPLDTVDGFMIESNKRYAWQDELYISKKSAAERTYKTRGFNIHQMEEERLIEFLSEDE